MSEISKVKSQQILGMHRYSVSALDKQHIYHKNFIATLWFQSSINAGR